VTAMTRAARPHIVNASANHSCTMIRWLSTAVGSKPATT
jgi:hypothetical protein